VQAQAQSLEE
jgi:hypothetical protein